MMIGLGSIMAAPVNSRTAQRVAENFWKGLTHKVANIEQVEEVSFDHLYVFHVNQSEGFVIVAADDRACPILAYGTDEVVGDMGPETRFWLGQYEGEIAALAAGTLLNEDVLLADYIAQQWNRLLAGEWQQPKSGNMVPAMLTTRWNQSPYYNYYCPQGCPAGCVATAVAQVMKYWNHPVRGTGYHFYNTSYGTLSAQFDTTYYDWAHMPNSISSSSTEQEIHAVALLSYHVGVAVEMNYEPDGSGASLVGYGYGASAQNALKSFFGYSNSLHGAYRSEYTDGQWVQMLKDELDAGRPVLYAGYDNSAGHAFVFDGYNSSNQFHVNWGWGGSYNGYYAVGALNPGGGGVGTNTSNTFNYSNQILVGVKPQPRLGANPTTLSFPAAGGSQIIAITSNYGDTASCVFTSSDSWFYNNPVYLSGSGNGATTNVTVTAFANNSGYDRTGILTVVQGSNTLEIPVQQFTCATEDMCTLTVGAYDRSGDGWNGARLTLASTSGAVFGEMTMADGSYSVLQYSVCPDTVLAIWHRGSNDAACSFFVENGSGVVLLNHVMGTAISDGDTFVIAHPCQDTGGLDPINFSVNVTINDSTRGSVEGVSDNVAFGESLSLTALANEGYRFTRWNDGSVTNPRTLTILADRTLTARFDDLGRDTLHYDNGTYASTYSGEEETHWGIGIPVSNLVGHTSLESIKFYNVQTGNYTLNVHQGDFPKHINLVYTKTFYMNRQSRYRWVEQRLDSVLALDYSKPLWITLNFSGGGAPACASAWCGNDAGAWYSDNGVIWGPLSNEGIRATWMLRAYMPYDASEYTLNVSSNNRKWGTASGGGLYHYGEGATLVATPKEGYHFEKWSDNNIENPRTFYVKGDQTIRAIFAEGEVGIDNAMPDNVVTYVEGRTLFVRGAEGHSLCVYDALGRQVYGSDNYQAISIPLPAAGVYVVRYDNQAIRKVVTH